MTRRDKWLNPPRQCVAKYWLYKDQLNLLIKKMKFVMPVSDYLLEFYIQMPASWSEAQKRKFDGKPHQQKPDKDNLEKAFLDAVLPDDSKVWDGRVSKYWGRKAMIKVYAPQPVYPLPTEKERPVWNP